MDKTFSIAADKVAATVANSLATGLSCDCQTEDGRDPLPAWKRAFDLLLIALTAPVWILLMAAVSGFVKLVSRGPSIYRQRRVGYGGKEFTIYKFRSMHVNSDVVGHENYVQSLIASNKPMTKLDAGDSRVIPMGRWLRALALDELPQIFNVLRGEMSLVGPRPCTPAEFACYQPEHRGRVAMLPGLTGSWQVGGKNKLTFDEMIELDLRYGAQMSLWLDTWIVLKTVPTLAGQLTQSFCRKHLRKSEVARTSTKPPEPSRSLTVTS